MTEQNKSKTPPTTKPTELSKDELKSASGGEGCFIAPGVSVEKKRPIDQATHEQKKRRPGRD